MITAMRIPHGALSTLPAIVAGKEVGCSVVVVARSCGVLSVADDCVSPVWLGVVAVAEGDEALLPPVFLVVGLVLLPDAEGVV